MTFIDAKDPHDDIDRKAADGQMSHEDAHALHSFADFLTNPTSRCPVCMGDDHTTPSTCLTPAEKASALPGVPEPELSERIDAGYARHTNNLRARLDAREAAGEPT